MNDDELHAALLLLGFVANPQAYTDYTWAVNKNDILIGKNKHFKCRYDIYVLGAGSNTFETAAATMEYMEKHL